jgi:hypothetical protein
MGGKVRHLHGGLSCGNSLWFFPGTNFSELRARVWSLRVHYGVISYLESLINPTTYIVAGLIATTITARRHSQ